MTAAFHSLPADSKSDTGAKPLKRLLYWAILKGNRLVFSISFSCATLALLLGLITADGEVSPSLLIDVLKKISLLLVGLYLGSQFLQALFRALRYQVLLRNGGERDVPRLGDLYLVTLARNMLVDMLPARAGELGYVALLNRGYQVSVEGGVSSLAASFLFDIIALFLVIFSLMVPMLLKTMTAFQVVGAAGLLLVLIAIAWWGWFYVMPAVVRHRWFKKVMAKTKLTARFEVFLTQLSDTLDQTRRSNVFLSIMFLSIAVRLSKYTGLYFLFLGVTQHTWPELAALPVWAVIGTLIIAEGAAALPIPAFMSFGPYEAGGAIALVLLGFKDGDAALAMLAIHVVSQAISYSLGGISILCFTYLAPGSKESKVVWTPEMNRIPVKKVIGSWFWAIGMAMIALALMVRTYRQSKVLKEMQQPPVGMAVEVTPQAKARIAGGPKGFVVWSSNRQGNHDIFRMSLPEGKIDALTDHPHTETFPRLHPDGKMLVFCRSQIPWVSQRDPVPWDLYGLNLETGEEELLAKNAYQPAWTSQGDAVVFVRNGDQIIELNLADKKERRLFVSGEAGLSEGLEFQTPSYNKKKGQLAVTLRGATRAVVVVEQGKGVVETLSTGGCQLSWFDHEDVLYWTDHGGNAGLQFMQNRQGKTEPLLDLPGAYSHQYFPKASVQGGYMVMGASEGGHEHDRADYELFLWKVGAAPNDAVRLTYHTGNDCWPDVFIFPES
ncbi:lysylphosphatidylglycerol synthase domain-containing protein [Kiritimatiellota bacterium B12222]|nr:lysylphosphatidylglycerol synthase domain-containing protein [Kiritimatiellota bacterium B12222]